jgi:hypothetical protein
MPAGSADWRTPCMPWTVWRLYGCRPMAFAQVGRQAEGSAGDRDCQLVSPGSACPGVPQAATCWVAPSRRPTSPAASWPRLPPSRVYGPGRSRLRTPAATKQDGRYLVGTARPLVQLISPRPRWSGHSPRRCRRPQRRCSDRSVTAAAPPEAAGNPAEAPRPACRRPVRR